MHLSGRQLQFKHKYFNLLQTCSYLNSSKGIQNQFNNIFFSFVFDRICLIFYNDNMLVILSHCHIFILKPSKSPS